MYPFERILGVYDGGSSNRGEIRITRSVVAPVSGRGHLLERHSLGSTDGARALGRRPAVLEGYLLWIFHRPLFLSFEAIRFHLSPSCVVLDATLCGPLV